MVGGHRVEQDVVDFLDLVHFGVHVPLLVIKIIIRRILFLSHLQDLYFHILDLVLFHMYHMNPENTVGY